MFKHRSASSRLDSLIFVRGRTNNGWASTTKRRIHRTLPVLSLSMSANSSLNLSLNPWQEQHAAADERPAPASEPLLSESDHSDNVWKGGTIEYARSPSIAVVTDATERGSMISTSSPPPSKTDSSSSIHLVTAPSASRPPSNAPTSSTTSEVPFDFQTFLDQMKTKGAEPVARYLRRHALCSIFSICYANIHRSLVF